MQHTLTSLRNQSSLSPASDSMATSRYHHSVAAFSKWKIVSGCWEDRGLSFFRARCVNSHWIDEGVVPPSLVSVTPSCSGPKPSGAFMKCCTIVGSFALALGVTQLSVCWSPSVSQSLSVRARVNHLKGWFAGQPVRIQRNPFLWWVVLPICP